MAIDESQVEKIVQQVVNRLFTSSGASTLKTVAAPSGTAAATAVESSEGLFEKIDDAIKAAKAAQKKFVDMGRDIRFKIVGEIRKASLEEKERLARLAVEETKLGRVEDKIIKLEVAALYSPGPEVLKATTYSNEKGTITVEGAPFGVIGAITPMTNPAPTVVNNTISIVSAGNAIVYLPHPSAHNVSIEMIKILHRAIVNAGGPPNLITAARESKIENAAAVFKSPDIDLLSVTGGPGIVRLAMKSGKRALGAGPGNPPVVVDDTADIEKAADDIVFGASFDNNILCNEEKICIVMRSVLDRLLDAFTRYKTVVLNEEQAAAVTKIVVDEKGEIVKSYMGKDCDRILKDAGISVDPGIKLAVFVAKEDHPIVQHEQLMPVLPVVVVDSFEEAVNVAIRVEHGFKHTSVIHSNNINRITKFAQDIDTTYVIINGPSQALAAETYRGGTTWTIAGATGEGVTTPESFVRERRLVVSGGMNFVK